VEHAVLEFTDIDLRSDAAAHAYVKRETVTVVFAGADGALQSSVGPNHYRAGDALVTGTDGDTWCVARVRFDARYEPVPPLQAGVNGRYRNLPQTVLARRIDEPFAVRRAVSGDWLRGTAGDWLLQYAPGDHGIAAAARFALVYHLAAAQPSGE
jgi:hypothetical protein